MHAIAHDRLRSSAPARLVGCLPATLGAAVGAGHREFSPCGEPVLHGEQRGRGPGRDADLGVGVLHVAVRGLGRDAQRARDLLGLQPAGQQADDLDLALGQPGRPRRRGGARCPAASSTAATLSASSRPARASLAEQLGGLLAAGAPRGGAAARSSRGRRRRRRAGGRPAPARQRVAPRW